MACRARRKAASPHAVFHARTVPALPADREDARGVADSVVVRIE